MGVPVIRVESLSKRYGSADAAGKATTLRLLPGLARPTAGRTEIFGPDCQRQALQAHRQFAYVPGEVTVYPPRAG